MEDAFRPRSLCSFGHERSYDQMLTCSSLARVIAFGVFLAGISTSSVFGQNVKPDVVLTYKPAQPGVDIDTPTGAEIAQCELKVESEGKKSGWVLYGPTGQVLRRFMDTNGDQKVDEFKYFKFGLEVYRDLDTDGDNKINESRWVNTHGTRWGVDTDQNGTIDYWKIISAEEATREAVFAMASGNVARLEAVFLTPQDAQAVGLDKSIGNKFLANRNSLGTQLQSVLADSKIINKSTEWVRFDSSMLMPNLVPSDAGKAQKDLLVYENVMAIVSNGDENGFVQIGEMVQVGSTWKLTQCPRPIEGGRFDLGEGGLLLQPTIPGITPGASEGISPEMRELVDQLRELDAKSPTAETAREDMIRFNVERATLLQKLANLSTTTEDQALWQRQRLELIAAATQMQTFPNGLAELKASIDKLRADKSDTELLAFAVFQNMLVSYNVQLQSADPEQREEVQSQWLKSLEAFVEEFPKAPEAGDALLQLAITEEFNGDLKDARVWYTRLVNDYPNSSAAQRGQGALRRLSLEGQPVAISGTTFGSQRPIDLASYRGKVTAVIFWATWCKPCTEDLPQIQQLYTEYQRQGFEIVGVNLDTPGADVEGYLRNYRVVWPQIVEEGGLEGRLAIDYGIISLPTMFLIDKSGRVVSNSASVEDLKTKVPELLRQ